ncbi:MAG: tRNA (adenosine(37)-N6)-dimethylallyltransferase MiaA [Gemmatimonadaceae bacterium]
MGDGSGVVGVICGPTGAGKSALAMALAAAHPVTIISADSRQVYRDFDIGTGKPSDGERARVPHEGINVVAPEERYSAAAWSAGAEGWIADARARGRVPLVVGGTGFYIRALTEPLFAEPELDAARRTALASATAALATPELRRWCAALDPARAHLGRAQLLRAIEVALLTGRPISEWQARPLRAPTVARYLVVDPGPVLKEWIASRVLSMLDAGWEAEVGSLMRDVPTNAPAWNATGYSLVREHVDGTITRDEMAARITIATRQYAKRQRTWFRHQLDGDVTMLDPTEPSAADVAANWFDGLTI